MHTNVPSYNRYHYSTEIALVTCLLIGPLQMVVVHNIKTALEVLVKKSSDFAERIRTPSRGYIIHA